MAELWQLPETDVTNFTEAAGNYSTLTLETTKGFSTHNSTGCDKDNGKETKNKNRKDDNQVLVTACMCAMQNNKTTTNQKQTGTFFKKKIKLKQWQFVIFSNILQTHMNFFKAKSLIWKKSVYPDWF